MRIAYLSCVMPPYPGGIGVAASGMAAEMARRGHDAVIFSPNKIRPWLRWGNAAFMPQLLWRLRRFDIIHLLYPFYGVAELVPLLRRTTKAKIVVHHMMDAVAPGLKGRVFNWHSRHIMPSILRAADRVLVLSDDYYQNSWLARLTFPAEKLGVVPHGIDTTLFHPPPHPHPLPQGEREQQKISPPLVGGARGGGPVVLFVGGLDRAHYFKGVPVLIEACRILKERGIKFVCQIIGDGDMRPQYEALTPLLNPPPLVGGGKVGGEGRIKFFGLIPHDQLPQYYQRAVVCVVPSTERIECFSIVAAEAQACGIPAIVTDFPGVRVTIEHGKTGFVISPANAEALADRIQWILEHPNEARAMGSAGRARVEQMYSWKVVGDRLEQVYASLYNS